MNGKFFKIYINEEVLLVVLAFCLAIGLFLGTFRYISPYRYYLPAKFSNDHKASYVKKTVSVYIKESMERYAFFTGGYPGTLEKLGILEKRVSPYKKANETTGPWTNPSIDPWGTPYKFQKTSVVPIIYTLTSAGPDKTFDTKDDISVPIEPDPIQRAAGTSDPKSPEDTFLK